METNSLSDLSRRHFISASLGAGAMVLAPGRLFGRHRHCPCDDPGGVGSEDRGYSTPPRYQRSGGFRREYRRPYWQGWEAPDRRRFYSLKTANRAGARKPECGPITGLIATRITGFRSVSLPLSCYR